MTDDNKARTAGTDVRGVYAETASIGQVFNNYPSGSVPPVSALSSTWRVPARHPAFLGRDEESDFLLQYLKEEGPIIRSARRCLIHGMGGVGKTELARAVSWALKEGPFQSAIEINMQGMSDTPLTPRDARIQVLGTFSVPMQNADAEEANRYHQLMEHHSLLLLLDNVRDEEQIRELLVDSARGAFLVTARNHLPLLDWRCEKYLKPFDQSTSVKLLKERAMNRFREQDIERDWEKLADLCGYLPLILHNAAIYLIHYRFLTVREMIEEIDTQGATWLAEGDAVLALSVTKLSTINPALVSLWQQLTLLRRPFSSKLAACVWNYSLAASKISLSLLDSHALLLCQESDGTFLFHDRMREIADKWEPCIAPEKRQEIHQRLADHFKQEASSGEIDPYSRELLEAAYHQFWASDRTVEQKLAKRCQPYEFWSLLESSVALSVKQKFDMISKLASFSIFEVQESYKFFCEEQERLKGIDPRYAHIVAKFTGKPELRGGVDPDEIRHVIRAHQDHNPLVLSLFAAEATQIPDWEREGWFQQAIVLDPTNAGYLGNFADFMENIRRDYEQAESLYRRAIESAPNDARHLGNFAVFMKNIRRDYDQAESLYRRAIESDPNHANHLGNFANFMKNIRRDYDQAESLYRRAIESDPN
ncbi:MAG: tetratricopeptide repeat protein, partial [Magnetococcales bacterium]|nr:tetratricopeptide repeat protein [Magnetococcales bacterium]